MIFFPALLFVGLAQTFPLKSAMTIDLTHPVNENTIAWPSATQFTVKQVFQDYTPSGFWYENRDISSSEHAGTHLDAPNHIRDKEGGWSTGDIPIERLTGPGVKIDVSKQSSLDPDYAVTAEDVLNFEAEFGAITEGTIVLVHTDRGKLYSQRDLYFGRPAGLDLPANDTENLHFPGVGQKAAQLLVQRKVYGVGIDTPSIDNGQSREFLTHRILLGENIWGLENVANTDQLPPRGFHVYNLVQKLEGGSGGPTRVIAILDHPDKTGL